MWMRLARVPYRRRFTTGPRGNAGYIRERTGSANSVIISETSRRISVDIGSGVFTCVKVRHDDDVACVTWTIPLAIAPAVQPDC